MNPCRISRERSGKLTRVITRALATRHGWKVPASFLALLELAINGDVKRTVKQRDDEHADARLELRCGSNAPV